MKTVYMVRHGESNTNARTTDICTPDSEVELTERGKEQSKFIAERAKHLPIEVIIASPYRRTKDTAAMITAVMDVPIEYNELFVERKVPDALVGKPFHSPETEGIYRRWIDAFYDPDARPDDGEHFSQLHARAMEALDLLEKRPEQYILVVSHGMFLRAVMASIMFGISLTPQIFRGIVAGTLTNNTGITMLTYGVSPHHDTDTDTARWRVRAFNDHAHLG